MEIPAPIPCNRECGDCGACCIWYAIREPNLKKEAGARCPHLTEPDNKCAIYDTRPETCRFYQCTWIKGELPSALRPDKYGYMMSRDDGKTCLRVTIITPPDPNRIETIARNAFRGGCYVVRFVPSVDSVVDRWRDGLTYVLKGGKIFTPDKRLIPEIEKRLAGMKQEFHDEEHKTDGTGRTDPAGSDVSPVV